MDLYIQKESPGADKQSNWLPAPDGEFILMLRLYWPKDEAVNGTWALHLLIALISFRSGQMAIFFALRPQLTADPARAIHSGVESWIFRVAHSSPSCKGWDWFELLLESKRPIRNSTGGPPGPLLLLTLSVGEPRTYVRPLGRCYRQRVV